MEKKRCQVCDGPIVNGRCKLCGMPYRNDETLYHLNENRSDHYRHATSRARAIMRQEEIPLGDKKTGNRVNSGSTAGKYGQSTAGNRSTGAGYGRGTVKTGSSATGYGNGTGKTGSGAAATGTETEKLEARSRLRERHWRNWKRCSRLRRHWKKEVVQLAVEKVQ